MEPFDEWAKTMAHPCVQAWADRLIELGASWQSFERDPGGIVDDLVSGGIPLLAARDIVKTASEALARSRAPLAIFWDLENMPIPTAVSGRQVAARIKSVLAAHGELVQFRGYASIGLGQIPQQKRSELHLSGCDLVDCPHNGRKEVADKMMIVDALQFAYEHPDGAALCFITADTDYAYLLSKLQHPKWKTIVVSTGSMKSMLHMNCDIKMRWEKDIIQNRLPPSASAIPDTLVTRDIQGKGIEPCPLDDASDGGSASSDEALTVAEESADDLELLRTVVQSAPCSARGTPGGTCALKSYVGSQLRLTNPARFPNREAVHEFLAGAIARGVVAQLGKGAFKMLHLPGDMDSSKGRSDSDNMSDIDQVKLKATSTSSPTSVKQVNPPSAEGTGIRWGNIFGAKEQPWKCKTCMTRNAAGTKKCAACEDVRPCTSEGEKKNIFGSSGIGSGGFSFGSAVPSGAAVGSGGFTIGEAAIPAFSDAKSFSIGSVQQGAMHMKKKKKRPRKNFCASSAFPPMSNKAPLFFGGEAKAGSNLSTPVPMHGFANASQVSSPFGGVFAAPTSSSTGFSFLPSTSVAAPSSHALTSPTTSSPFSFGKPAVGTRFSGGFRKTAGTSNSAFFPLMSAKDPTPFGGIGAKAPPAPAPASSSAFPPVSAQASTLFGGGAKSPHASAPLSAAASSSAFHPMVPKAPTPFGGGTKTALPAFSSAYPPISIKAPTHFGPSADAKPTGKRKKDERDSSKIMEERAAPAFGSGMSVPLSGSGNKAPIGSSGSGAASTGPRSFRAFGGGILSGDAKCPWMTGGTSPDASSTEKPLFGAPVTRPDAASSAPAPASSVSKATAEAEDEGSLPSDINSATPDTILLSAPARQVKPATEETLPATSPGKKLCAGCGLERGRDKYSKCQWKKRIGSGRCLDCVTANQSKQQEVTNAGIGSGAGGGDDGDANGSVRSEYAALITATATTTQSEATAASSATTSMEDRGKESDQCNDDSESERAAAPDGSMDTKNSTTSSESNIGVAIVVASSPPPEMVGGVSALVESRDDDEEGTNTAAAVTTAAVSNPGAAASAVSGHAESSTTAKAITIMQGPEPDRC